MQIDRPITIALILFAVLLMVFFLVAPEYDTFGRLQTELGQKKAEFNAEFDYYAQITKIYFDLQSRKDDVKKIDNALPPSSDLGEVVYFLQESAKANGMMVKDLFLSKTSTNVAETKVGGVKDIVFSIDLIGDYSSLESFIISLEKSARIFEITTITFGSESELSSKSFSLQIKTHSY